MLMCRSIQRAHFSARCALGRCRVLAHHRVLLLWALCVLPFADAHATDWFPSPSQPAMYETGIAPRLRLDPLGNPGDPATPGPPASRGAYVWPALASAVVPGAGEIVTGHIWNGIPLLAAEVAIWVGFAHYNDQGNQLRSDYEAFAERYWDYDRWQNNLQTWYDPNSDPPGTPPWWNPTEYPGGCDCSPPYIPKEDDPQEYYENAGKYRHFWPGWQDWVYNPNDPKNSDSVALRAEYISMRNRSNDAFDNRGTMLGLAVVTRLVSVAQTLFLVRRDQRAPQLQVAPIYSSRRGAGMKLTWSY